MKVAPILLFGMLLSSLSAGSTSDILWTIDLRSHDIESEISRQKPFLGKLRRRLEFTNENLVLFFPYRSNSPALSQRKIPNVTDPLQLRVVQFGIDKGTVAKATDIPTTSTAPSSVLINKSNKILVQASNRLAAYSSEMTPLEQRNEPSQPGNWLSTWSVHGKPGGQFIWELHGSGQSADEGILTLLDAESLKEVRNGSVPRASSWSGSDRFAALVVQSSAEPGIFVTDLKSEPRLAYSDRSLRCSQTPTFLHDDQFAVVDCDGFTVLDGAGKIIFKERGELRKREFVSEVRTSRSGEVLAALFIREKRNVFDRTLAQSVEAVRVVFYLTKPFRKAGSVEVPHVPTKAIDFALDARGNRMALLVDDELYLYKLALEGSAPSN